MCIDFVTDGWSKKVIYTIEQYEATRKVEKLQFAIAMLELESKIFLFSEISQRRSTNAESSMI